MAQSKRKISWKYVIAASLIIVFAVAYVYDYFRAKTYKVEIVSVSQEEPLASDKERVEITVFVTRFGKPMKGHELFALPDAGRMLNYNAVTDEDGYASFTYIPYTSNKFNQAKDVTVKIRDESNSVIWEINAYGMVILKLKDA